ncbi:MAG: protein kinase [Acidobacteriota bacterium]
MAPDPSSPDLLPGRLGPCRPDALLGTGSYGSVYRGKLIKDRPYAAAGTSVAVKVLRPERVDSATLMRFQREGELGQVVDHPAVVRTFELGTATVEGVSQHFLVMEYVEGRTLRQVMNRLGPVPEPLLRALAGQIAEALEAVHRAGAVHRDLKPTNILLTPDYQVKLMDLGIAGLIGGGGRLTQTGYFVGTLDYASPEQITGAEVGPISDLYSLGVVLYEAATASQPFAVGDPKAVVGRHLNTVPDPISQLRPEISLFLEAVITCLLEKAPEDRFVTAADLARALDDGESSRWWAGRRPATEGTSTDRLAVPEVSRDTPFQGRHDELTLLQELWHGARAGRGSVLLIEGEAGVGKSRLMHELTQRLRQRSRQDAPRVLYGSNTPGDRHGPGALADSLITYLGGPDVEQQLIQLLPQTPQLAPAFAALLAGLPPPTGSEPLSPDAVHALFRQLARSLSSDGPILWLLDDLHFAGAAARARLASVAAVVGELPILLVVSARPGLPPEDLEPFLDLRHGRRLSLERLAVEEVQRMVHEALGGLTGSHRLAKRIAVQSDGNPLFVAEMLRELAEQRQNPTAAEPLQAVIATPPPSSSTGTVPLPGSVRGLLEARLRDLDSEDRAVLDAAAVYGFRFDPEIIAKVRDISPIGLLERLVNLERRTGLVRSSGRLGHFDHHLLQELLYTSLPPILRRAYHARLAEVLLARHGDVNDGELAVDLCRHFLRGDRPEEGMRYAVPAVDHLAASYDWEALLDLSDLALEAEVGGSESGRQRRCELLLKRCDCFFVLGRREEEAEAAAAAAVIADELGHELLGAQARLYQGRHLLETGSAEATDRLQEALQLAGAASKSGEEQAEAVEAEVLGLLGHSALRAGDFASARTHSLQQLELCRALGDDDGTADAACALGAAQLGLDQPSEALRYLEEGIRLAGQRGLERTRARALADLALAHYLLSDFPAARSSYESALALARDLGFLEAEALALGNFCLLCLAEGAVEQAEELDRQLRDVHRALGSPFHTAFGHFGTAEILRARRRLDEARRQIEKGLAACRELGAAYGVLEGTTALARVAYEQGDPESSGEAVQQALQLIAETGIDAHRPLLDAYLAALGKLPPKQVELPTGGLVATRAEICWLLAQAGREGALTCCREMLDTLSRHLTGDALRSFWAHQPIARAFATATEIPDADSALWSSAVLPEAPADLDTPTLDQLSAPTLVQPSVAKPVAAGTDDSSSSSSQSNLLKEDS